MADSLDRLDLIKKIEENISCYSPDTVYVHHSGDLNIDHRRIHEAGQQRAKHQGIVYEAF